jgi:hypothetical protein
MQLFIQLHQTQSWWIPLPRYQLLLPVWDMVCSSHMAISFFVFACDRCFPWFMSGRQTDLIWSDLIFTPQKLCIFLHFLFINYTIYISKSRALVLHINHTRKSEPLFSIEYYTCQLAYYWKSRFFGIGLTHADLLITPTVLFMHVSLF